MQYPGDDMDELFRQAAENYPLNTNNADWSKVQAMLDPEAAVVSRKSDKRQFLWLLLLLPFYFICNRAITPANNKLAVNGAHESTIGTSSESGQAVQNRSVKDPETDQAVPITSTANKTEDPGAGTASNSEIKASVRLKSKPAGSNSPDLGLSNHDLESMELNTKAGRKQSDRIYSSISSRPFLVKKNKSQIIDQKATPSNGSVANTGSGESKTSVTTTSGNTNAIASIVDTDKTADAAAKATPVEDGSKQGSGQQDTSAIASQPATKEADKKSVITTQRRKRFYIGLIGAPDVSTIKFEKFSDVGFEAGIILGYDLSKKFAVEAGVFSDKKYYAGNGEYLNTSKLYMPANAKLTAVSGNCRMIEIPVVLKYNISNKGNHSWFASTGISSYLMSREDYSYDYYYYSSGTTYTHNKVYTNETKNWVSVLQVSAGYSHRLGRIGDFRIEPYYKLPLKGLGYGELPISSLGVHFGITRKLF